VNELALFAGAGGGILGGHLLGWRTVSAVELDALGAAVLAQRQNDGCLQPFPIWSDVQTFDGAPWRGLVDIVSAGFPCQDISSAGKGAGINGEQSGLWREAARVIRDVEPGGVWLENSPILTSRGLGVVLGDLATLGFDAEWDVFSARDVGFGHLRERIWVLATHPKRHFQPREEQRCRKAGRMGRQQQPVARNANWEGELSRLRGMGNGLARAVDRTDCIRNGQVPAVAAAAFAALAAEFE
jgi:DNA (cytosine-5)-methyltransferase 1